MFVRHFVVVTCSALTLSNGGVNYSTNAVSQSYTVDTVASFSCNRGYSLSGSTSRTCQTSRLWTSELPTCSQSDNLDEEYFTVISKYKVTIIMLL